MPEFPVPTEARLETLLREAFEFMPGPDMVRLREIEARLLRTTRRPAARRATLPWWAILLLAGGAATAAWWAGEQYVEQKRAAVRLNEESAGSAPKAGHERPAAGAKHRQTAPEPSGAAQGDNEDPIIYKREAP
jgi:hypothetical protein